ncbi:MAG: hypothetical protein V3V05_02615 [Pontiella sp.]
MERYCIKCHGEKRQYGGMHFDELDGDLVLGPDAEAWHSALDMINAGDLPQEYEDQLSEQERQTVVNWITDQLKRTKKSQRNTPSGSIRRLTQAQYTHSLNDLYDGKRRRHGVR